MGGGGATRDADEEASRLAALERYAVLDTPPHPRFDRLTRLAASVFGTPMAAVTLIDAHRQWFKSRVGIDVPETPRDVAFCGHTIGQTAVFVVEDARADPRFAANPLVVGPPHIAFYAGAPLRTADGHAVGALAILDRAPRSLRDVEREQLLALAALAVDELELAAAEHRFQALVAGAPDVTFLLDAAGACTYVSPGVGALLGRRPEDLVGTHLEIPQGAGGRATIELRHADGSPRWVELVTRDLLADPTVRAVVVNGRDVTERARRERRERRIADLGLEGLRASDVDAFVAAAAALAGDELGVPVEVVREEGGVTSLRAISPPAPADAPFLRAVANVVGAVTGAAAARRDLAAAEEQLRHAQKLEAVGRFAGGVAHDFNNLLTVIFGGAAFLARRLPPGPLTEEVKQIRSAAERAAMLTRQVLAFSRRQVLRDEYLDLNEVVTALVPMVQRGLGETHVVDLAAAPERLVLRADRGQLEQVVVTLCLNARDAMPGGGVVSLRTGSARRERPMVWLAVADAGAGMPPEVVARLYEPFFTTKGVGQGVGLGLAAVHGIVQQHGGSIAVDTVPGRGTTFTVTLPAAAGEPHPAVAPAAPRAGDETVLVAEDDDAVRRVAVRTLETGGYRVLVARDGEEAVAVFRAHAAEIAAVVLDVVMPRRGGISALEEMRALRPALPAIFCSGYGGEIGDVREPWLQKPYEPDALLAELRRVIDEE